MLPAGSGVTLSLCEPSPALPQFMGETGNGADRKLGNPSAPSSSQQGEMWDTVTPGAGEGKSAESALSTPGLGAARGWGGSALALP